MVDDVLEHRFNHGLNPVLAALLTRTSAHWAVGIAKPPTKKQSPQRVCGEEVGVCEHE